jgi:hypothetical protein
MMRDPYIHKRQDAIVNRDTTDIIDKELTELSRGAVRTLLELETQAKDLRDRLEEGDNTIVDLTHPLTDMYSLAMNMVSILDRSLALELLKGRLP